MGTNIIEGPNSFWGSLFSGSFRELNVVTETNGEKSTTSFFNGYMQQLFIQTRQSYIYPTVCLPTLRLSGSQHQCLILIPPTAFAFGFIVFYWCALKWLSCTLSAEIYARERMHAPFWKTLRPLEMVLLEANTLFRASRKNPVLSPARFFCSSSSSWVVSCCLGQINEPQLTSGWGKKDGKRHLSSWNYQ